MKPEHFAYWMKGYIDNNENIPSMDDWNKIKRTLIDCFIQEYNPRNSSGTGRNEVYHIIAGKPNSGGYGGGL